jgi:hypothetical protein
MQTWSDWKRFGNTSGGEATTLAGGPGIYEVRHSLTGRAIAFGYANDVEAALDELRRHGAVGTFARWFSREAPLSRLPDLEYRTCSAASRAEAKTTASRLLGLRQAAFRQRFDAGRAIRW